MRWWLKNNPISNENNQYQRFGQGNISAPANHQNKRQILTRKMEPITKVGDSWYSAWIRLTLARNFKFDASVDLEQTELLG
jgi:hypothetical protein